MTIAADPDDRPVYEWTDHARTREPLELWRRRDLLFRFVWKEFTVRYKQTAIGIGWVVLQPLAFAAMFAGVILHGSSSSFGLLQGSNFVPLYIGMCFWLMVASIVLNGSSALLNNQSLLSKVYFPRQIPVLAASALALVDFLFAISLTPFFALLTNTRMSALGYVFAILMAFPLALAGHGLALLLAALVLRFRDVRIVVPYVVNLLFFFSSAMFPLGLYAPQWRTWVLSNPIAATIDIARHLALRLPLALDRTSGLRAIGSSVVFLALGVAIFRRTQRRLVEQL